MRNFAEDLRPDAHWNRPKNVRPAQEFVEELSIQLEFMRRSKPEQAVRILYGGVFGVMRALRVTAKGKDTLGIVVRGSDGVDHGIVAPVSQCSFMLSFFAPTVEEPDERIILGFAEGQA